VTEFSASLLQSSVCWLLKKHFLLSKMLKAVHFFLFFLVIPWHSLWWSSAFILN